MKEHSNLLTGYSTIFSMIIDYSTTLLINYNYLELFFIFTIVD